MFLYLRLSLLLLTLSATSFCLAIAAPDAKTKHFDLPTQTLAASLIEFALQAHTTVIVEDSLVAELQSHPVNGRLNVEQALAQLLTGTQLAFSFQPQTGSYLIHTKPILPTPAPATATTPATQPIEEVVVIGYLMYPFRYTTVSNSQQQARVAYFDSVRFANVLPQQLIADQQTEDFSEVLKYASGVMPADGLSDTNDDIFIRGFHRSALFLDGYRLGDTTGLKLMPESIERIEILKGPATVLFGQAEPGGTLNFIAKKPTDTSFIHSEIATGTLGKKRLSVDANSHRETIDTRLIIADHKQDHAGDVSDIHRQLITPSITWNPTEQAQLALNYHWQHNYQMSDTNNESIARFYQTYPERSPKFDTRFQFFTTEFNYELSPNWQLGLEAKQHRETRKGVRTSSDTLTNTNVLLKGQAVGENILVMPLGGRVAVPLNIIRRGNDWSFTVGNIQSLYAETGEESGDHAAIHLNGDTELFSMEHKLSFGIDWFKQDLFKEYISEVTSWFYSQEWKSSQFDTVMNDIANKLFAADRQIGSLRRQASKLIAEDKGVFFSDSITLNDSWVVSLGGRYSEINGDLTYFKSSDIPAVSNDTTSSATNPGAKYTLPSYHDFSSQVGFVYKPSEANSWYFNYSEAVRANYRVDAPDAKNALPETSNQFEVGVKSLLFDGRLLSSLGLYKITKKDISEITTQLDKLNSLSFYDQSVQGVDLDLTWQASPKLDVMTSIAFLDAAIESGKQKGEPVPDIASHSASLFAHYKFNSHWACDLGVSYLGSRMSSTFGDKINSANEKLEIPYFATVDIHLTYLNSFWGKPAEFKLSVKNATNEYYYAAFVAGVRPNIAEERSILGALRLKF
ncbi:MAG: hypothetical protein RL497_2500 [Pseudomonadota bacterium]|jgi:outer membrane receptor protein involved in Fe transport